MKVYEEFTGTFTILGVDYLYRGSHRDWHLPEGFEPPTNTVWEVRTEIDGQLRAALGDSRGDALDKLKNLVTKIRKNKL